MLLTINGKPVELQDGTSLMDYLVSIKVNFKFLAVGYNGEVLPKTEYNGITLKHGDVLEVVRPIGGG
jgi:sulfur carrier protein